MIHSRKIRLIPARATLLAIAAFALAAALAVGAAVWVVRVVENRSAALVTSALLAEGATWARVETDGLRLHLIGTAPSEAARFHMMNIVGSVIDAARVRDDLEVAPVRAIEPPRFSVEILRNDDGISLIGLLPGAGSPAVLAHDIAATTPGLAVSDMLESAAYPAPEGWDTALAFGLEALKMLPRSKISVAADRVAITAIADSAAEKRRLQTALASRKPEGLAVVIDISAPRPVLTPFTLRFVRDAEGARFDACSADTERARARILAAALAAGADAKTACTIGLGVPSPSWAEATEAGIRAVAALGAGTITFSDADVTLLAAPETPQATFDRVVGELQAALPPVFSLQASLPKKPDAALQGPAEFTAALADDGKVELRGRLTDQTLRNAVDSFARANFGASKVYTATRLDPELPDGWPVRVLAGLQSLAELHSGNLVVRADTVEITGITGSQDARARITQILSGKLGQGQSFKVSVTYDEKLDPLAALPTPEECMTEIGAALAAQKIIFAPASAEIAPAAHKTLDALAEILTRCPDLRLEIGGHTDAQGSAEGNRALSQARAEAVLMALQGRRAPVTGLTAVGYGEDQPIADNGTDAGREANRRIEFRRIGTDQAAVVPPAADPAAADPAAADPAAAGASETPPPADPSALDCALRLNAILASKQVVFKPGSAAIDRSAAGTLDALSIILSQCPDARLEIGGHSDREGVSEADRALSEARAKAVLAEMTLRKAPVAGLSAFGYGAGGPLADSGSNAGSDASNGILFTALANDAGPRIAAPNEGATADPGLDVMPAGEVPTGDSTEPDLANPDSGTGGPDFSADTSPSVAPTSATIRPKPRPQTP